MHNVQYNKGSAIANADVLQCSTSHTIFYVLHTQRCVLSVINLRWTN